MAVPITASQVKTGLEGVIATQTKLVDANVRVSRYAGRSLIGRTECDPPSGQPDVGPAGIERERPQVHLGPQQSRATRR